MPTLTAPAPAAAAPSCRRFNDLLAAARHHKLPGWWDGSAFRDHPCGVIRKGIIFANQWNTNGYCYADVILDPSAEIIPGMNEPACSGNPYPRPASGGVLRVYSTGRWVDEDGPWRGIIVRVLDDLEREIATAKAAEAEVRAVRAAAQQAAHAHRVAAAHAALSLSAEG